MQTTVTLADIVEQTGLSERTVWNLLARGDIAPARVQSHKGKPGRGGRPPLLFPASVIDKIRKLYDLPQRDCETCGGQHGAGFCKSKNVIENHIEAIFELLARSYDSLQSDAERELWQDTFGDGNGVPTAAKLRGFLDALRAMRGENA